MSDLEVQSTEYTSGINITVERWQIRLPMAVGVGTVRVHRNDLGTMLQDLLCGYKSLDDEKVRTKIKKMLTNMHDDRVVEIGRPDGWMISFDVKAVEEVPVDGTWITATRIE